MSNNSYANRPEFSFTIEKQVGLARVGTIHTPHGDIPTPAFVAAATLGDVKGLTWQQLDELGSDAALANTYHLILQPGTDLLARASGLNNFTGHTKPTFTDSGGFQIFSLPEVKITNNGATFRSHLDGHELTITPESSMQAQWQIGADIHMAFDQLAASNSREDMQIAMERTHAWAERCLREQAALYSHYITLMPKSQVFTASPLSNQPKIPPYQALFGVVQGGKFLDLRRKSAKTLAEMEVSGQVFDGFGIGGVFTADGMDTMLQLVNQILPSRRPRHLLGMGAEPRDLFIGAEFGCDTFDCVAPTRQARNGALYTRDGRINIKNAKYRHDFSPIDPECNCYTCQHHSKAYLAHLFHAHELTAGVLASIHNEYFVVNLTKQIRESLLDDTFQTFKRDYLTRYYAKNML
ncbi:MAG: tRNA guanosine(34) transglycosylase Tgt [Candidatus Nomurabacteria bacterium]|jgi:queuine tRNA-ribosyltransferase|nr:tRNA guanosine(34) transglycosylase Tgt [Candidatus Nomurabacteria bacterium]